MKKYILLSLFFLNFAFVFEHGKMDVKVGTEMRAQDADGENTLDVTNWTVDDWLNFGASGMGTQFGFDITEINSLNELLSIVLDDFITEDLIPAYIESNSNCSECYDHLTGGAKNITKYYNNVSILVQDTDGDGIYDYKTITNLYGGGIIQAGPIVYEDPDTPPDDFPEPTYDYTTDPIIYTDAFIAWYQQNYGMVVPEVVSNDIIEAYYNYQIIEQENSITGTPTGGGSGLTETEKIALTASLTANLNAKIQSKYGTSSLPMPSVTYDSTKGGYAVHKNGAIFTTNAFFNLLTTEGDRMSCLLHEYTHYVHFIKVINNPVYNDQGVLTIIETKQPKVWTLAEHDFIYNDKKKEYPTKSEIELESLTQTVLKKDYVYKCSNYYKEEIAAMKAELQGELDGLYTLTEIYREQRNYGIKACEFALKRALDYESLKSLKPNGSSK